MQKYVRCHIVEAEPMTRGEHLKSKGLALVPGSGSESDEGYFIQYPDGYKSWCPKEAFEKAARPVDGMTFGQALEALKQGQKVARRGWNGKGMYLWLKPATVVKSEWCRDPELKKLVDANGGELLALGTICMYTHDSTGRKAILTGWLASQSDMLLEDWMIV